MVHWGTKAAKEIAMALMVAPNTAQPGTCTVYQTSPLTGTDNSMSLPVSYHDVLDWAQGNRPGLIQNVFPELNADQREFLMTGYTPEDWAKIFPPGEED